MDNNKPIIAALIVAAGSGVRFSDAQTPKQYARLLGRPVLRWSVDALRSCGDIGTIAVVIQPEHRTTCEAALAGIENTNILIIDGDTTRQQSVRRGLEALSDLAERPAHVLIHDAARPCVSAALLQSVCAELRAGHAAAIPALPVTDTVKKRDENGAVTTQSRDGLFTVQTPQGFAFDTIRVLHRQFESENLTDDAALLERAGQNPYFVTGQRDNIKITWPDDILLAESILSASRADIRTGKGYDVHRLVPPQHDLHKLVIGGIVIPHEKALEGHSDADVGLHAITDALLGTICDGDIGMHFSPKDARWKGADSGMFLQHAAALLSAQGGVITHVDLTVICEMPKIGPHRDAMRARISELLHLPLRRVSVKATTTEGLGFTGRGEGIAAEAVVTVRLPFETPADMSAHSSENNTATRKAI